MDEGTFDRRKFKTCVYLIAGLFMLLTLFQWAVLVTICDASDIFRGNYAISLGFLGGALLLITLFVFNDSLRMTVLVNWMFAFFIVECVTFGLAIIMLDKNVIYYGLVTIASILFLIAFICVATYMKHDVTLDIVILFVLSIIFFMTSIICVLLYASLEHVTAMYLYSGVVIVTTTMYMCYHVQTINGGRYAEMRLTDSLLASLIIYHDYIILFVVFFIIIYNAMEVNNMGFGNSECFHGIDKSPPAQPVNMTEDEMTTEATTEIPLPPE
ncbi:uncharacterized protein LOC119689772 isoform X2 [Teleopsis dalmanni]|nr:uncharacterized protein LOC119689772 isoform X2 [Teleopsis dalmanni]